MKMNWQSPSSTLLQVVQFIYIALQKICRTLQISIAMYCPSTSPTTNRKYSALRFQLRHGSNNPWRDIMSSYVWNSRDNIGHKILSWKNINLNRSYSSSYSWRRAKNELSCITQLVISCRSKSNKQKISTSPMTGPTRLLKAEIAFSLSSSPSLSV